MNHSIVDSVARYLGLSPDEVRELAMKAPTSYRRYLVPKKKGGKRTIFHPSKKTKMLQYAVMEILLTTLPVHQAAVGYIRGIKSPLLKHARKHAGYPYSVRLDFRDFFPSIVPSDLINVIEESEGGTLMMESDDADFVGHTLFVRYPNGKEALAIGAPSSPLVSNGVMFSLDEKIMALAKTISSESVYTRYADDIYFSSSKRGACKEFAAKLQELLVGVESPKLQLNAEKTVFSSRATRRVVTGLYICPDGGISIGRKNKRYIRKLIFELGQNRLEEREKAYLSGYLSFILDVEPDFFNRLVLKYGADLMDQARLC